MEQANNKREKSKFSRFLKGLITLVNIVMVLALLFSAWSQQISPEIISWSNLMGLAFPILLVCNMLWVLAWILQFNIRCLLSTVAIIICWGEVLTYCPFNDSTDPSVYEQTPRNLKFKLLSYNVMGWDGNKKLNGHNGSVDLIKEVDADLVCIQECGYTNNEKYLTRANIREQLNQYPYIQDDEKRGGMVLFSKFPIVKSWYKRGNTTLGRTVFYALNLGKDTLIVINNHLVSTGLSITNRVAFDSISRLNHSPEELVNAIEIPQKLAKKSQVRAQQINELSREIIQLKKRYRYVVLCGDLNDSPISYTHYTIRQLLGDAYMAKGRGPGISYNKNRLWVRIDHIMPCSHLETTKCTVIHSSKRSDHYPIVANILLK